MLKNKFDVYRYLTECMGLKEDKETLSKMYESMRRKYLSFFFLFTVKMSLLDKRSLNLKTPVKSL